MSRPDNCSSGSSSSSDGNAGGPSTSLSLDSPSLDASTSLTLEQCITDMRAKMAEEMQNALRDINPFRPPHQKSETAAAGDSLLVQLSRPFAMSSAEGCLELLQPLLVSSEECAKLSLSARIEGR